MKCNVCSCGEKPNVLSRKSVLGERMYAVRCPSCHRATDSCFERKEAIELWNGSYGKDGDGEHIEAVCVNCKHDYHDANGLKPNQCWTCCNGWKGERFTENHFEPK